MPHFDVPGWSVPAAAPTPSSSKRKRPNTNTNAPTDAGVGRIKSAEMNLDKLMNKLRGDKDEAGEGKTKGEGKGKKRKRLATATTLVQASPPKSAFKFSFKAPNGDEEGDAKKDNVMAKKKGKGKANEEEGGLTALQKNMKASLDGARFRWINEVLYKAASAESHEMMRNDPSVYEEYHTGFRHQVLSWPTNPVSHYASALAAYPPKTVIADLGCGDAALARALLPKGMTVLSFDLVSDGGLVVEADVCTRVPLPGCEGGWEVKGKEGAKKAAGQSQGDGGVVDVTVCALSLMGTNWPGTVREAWRIMRADGELKIAEVASRFTDVDEFISLVGSIGFRLVKKDDGNTHFTLFEFVKVARKVAIGEREWEGVLGRAEVLKACEYKRR
ncbi:hypothetical protein FIBSPDRAFT_735242 [Athelia psychrophila]|uniref:Ribosomal RNA-processing protein 8 n=1 Tax=Athelia psychrophila TaxID=1759441 RepID=A0A166N1W0_9AGAM|nr:hypothetical protein FIBSPDRAFT_735242 [Fibularhizoctonia sp. CBS 109695]